MRLSFISRLAFICNIFFLLAALLQIINYVTNGDVTATIAIIGYFMALLLNPLLILCYMVLFFTNRKVLATVPTWLIAANLVFLVLQIIYIFYLNDTKHY